MQLKIENAIIQVTENDLLPTEEPENPVIDSEIQQMAERIASDPMLFKNRFEMVNRLGVIGDLNPIERIWLTMKARWFNKHVCKNEEKLIERLDQAILDVIDNPDTTKQTTAIGKLF